MNRSGDFGLHFRPKLLEQVKTLRQGALPSTKVFALDLTDMDSSGERLLLPHPGEVRVARVQKHRTGRASDQP